MIIKYQWKLKTDSPFLCLSELSAVVFIHDNEMAGSIDLELQQSYYFKTLV